MPRQSITGQATVAGVTAYNTINRDVEGGQGYQSALAAAIAGTLTTRTDDDTGVITVASHTLSNGDYVDVYWATGRRYRMKVSSNDATTLTIGTAAGDVAAGDNLPADETAVTIAKESVMPIAVSGALIAMILANSTLKGTVCFLDAAGDVLLVLKLAAGESYQWPNGDVANPLLASTVASVSASNGDSTGVNTVTVGVAVDIV